MFAAASTILFDFVTALFFGWQFHQPLAITLLGQVPFTLNHLLGNVLLCVFVSPLLYRYVLENPALEVQGAGAPTALKS